VLVLYSQRPDYPRTIPVVSPPDSDAAGMELALTCLDLVHPSIAQPRFAPHDMHDDILSFPSP